MNDNKEKRVSRVREMKNELILDAALEVFSEKGFHDTRLEDIAQQAGFSKASLYNYYKDKEMIFLCLATREYLLIQERMKNDPVLSVDSSLPLKENLRRILTLIFTSFGNHFAFVLTLNSFQFFSIFDTIRNKKEDQEDKGEQIGGKYENVIDSIQSVFIDLVQDAKDKGEIKTPLSAKNIHSLFDAIIDGTVREWHSNRKMGDIEETVDQLVGFILNGLSSQE